MAAWTPCPEHCRSLFDDDSLRAVWPLLHLGDGELWPSEPALREGWRLYHEGDFEAAACLGFELGDAGLSLAFKASCVHANYVEAQDSVRFMRLLDIAERAARQRPDALPRGAVGYWRAYALGRYSQGISVARALARGLGRQVRETLESTLGQVPDHVDAHLALARFHAETIDQVGELIGGMVHGARKERGLQLYEAALALAPQSLIVLGEAAEGLSLLDGETARSRVDKLRDLARSIAPLDAMEKLYREVMFSDTDL